MAIDALGAVGSPTDTTPANATVNQNEFLKILLTQLKFQDPMKPVDNQQFLAQLAQFSAIEINRQQSAKIDTLLQMDTSAQAVNLLGQQIEVNSSQFQGVGKVTAVSFNTGEPLLTVRNTAGTVGVGVHLRDVKLVQEGT
jgi:flagellar basal-body rod modification protein FlgD